MKKKTIGILPQQQEKHLEPYISTASYLNKSKLTATSYGSDQPITICTSP
ncbi:MAG: hypothetical protein WCQ95_08210 [Bacteroidota bacterium]